MSVVIESNIPIPGDNSRRTGLAGILRGMAVGDSFLWPEAKRNSLYVVGKSATPSAKYVMRKVEEGQVRIWRKE